MLDAQIASLRSEFEMEENELNEMVKEEGLRHDVADKGSADMARLRKADSL